MKRLVLASLFCLAFAACSSIRHINVNDKGRVIEVKEGQSLSLTLAENPTTGFQWSLEPYDNLVLKPDGSPEFTPESFGRVGSGGEKTWRFLANKPGRATLRLNYCRPWVKGIPPAETYTVDILVKSSR